MESKPNRPKLGARRIMVSFIAVALALVVVVGLLWASNLFGWRKWRVNEVQQFIGAELPTEAYDIQFATDNQKTRIVWIRFNIPAETDLTPFVEELGFNTTLRENFSPFPAANFNEAALSWWTPFNAQQFSGLYGVQDGNMVELLRDQTDPANSIVYLRVYTLGMN